MANENYGGAEKREFLRYKHERPVNYKIVSPYKDGDIAAKFIGAVSKNLSVSGILFKSNFMPQISSVIIMDLDYRTSRICQEIEDRTLTINDKVVGKVVRIEANDDGTYDVGVAFVKKSDKLPDGIA